MEAAARCYIKLFDGDVYGAAFCKRYLASHPDGSWTAFHLFLIQLGDDRQTAWSNLQACSVSSFLCMFAILDTMHTITIPPPQVDVYTYRDKKIREAGTIRKILAPFVLCPSLHISPLKKAVVYPFQLLVANRGKTENAYDVQCAYLLLFVKYPPHRNWPSLSKLFLLPKFTTCGRDHSLCQRYLEIADVQMYLRPVGRLGGTDNHKRINRLFFLEKSGEPVSESGQKQDESLPNPEKQKPGKPETEKSEGEGTKGSQRVKRPKKRIGTPSPPKEQGFSGLIIALRWFC